MSGVETDLVALLRERGIVDADDAHPAASVAQRPMPWWLMLLQGLAAWFASLMIISALALPLGALGSTTLVRGVMGGVLCAAAIWLFRRDRLFSNQMALAFSLAGQGLLMWALADHWGLAFDEYRQMAAVGALVTGAMLVVRATRLHRVVCALILSFELGVIIGSGLGADIYGMALTAAVMSTCVTRERWATHPGARWLGPLSLAAGLAALVLPVILRLARDRVGTAVFFSHSSFVDDMGWLGTGAALLLLALAVHLLRAVAMPLRMSVLAFVLLWGVVLHAAPGLIVATGVFIAAFHASQRTLAAFALLAAVLYVGEFYYLLDLSLLHKSGLLALGGAALLVLRGCLRWLGGGVERGNGRPAVGGAES